MFKFLRSTHRWIGVVAALWFLLVASTGVLLLLKKRVSWIQPPTAAGTPGALEEVISISELYAAVLETGYEGFESAERIARIDFRPEERVFKVVSSSGRGEVQVDATTGAILGVSTRRSDLIENLHDGSFFGAWVHAWLMPGVGAGVVILTLSGLWLWGVPFLQRRRRRRDRVGEGGEPHALGSSRPAELSADLPQGRRTPSARGPRA